MFTTPYSTSTTYLLSTTFTVDGSPRWQVEVFVCWESVYEPPSSLAHGTPTNLSTINILACQLLPGLILPNGTVTLEFPRRSKYASPAAWMTSLESLSATGMLSQFSSEFQYAVPVALNAQSPESLTRVSIFVTYKPSPSMRTPRTYLCCQWSAPYPWFLLRNCLRVCSVCNNNFGESGTQLFIQNTSVLRDAQWFGEYPV
jgi:hypothetical protein